MPPYLEVVEGPAKGRKVEIPIGKAVTVGRTNRSMVSFAEDEWMSGMHFAIGLRNGTLFLSNLSKTNGTELNGERTEWAALKTGDTIKAGQTAFSVMASPASPFPAQFRIGGWSFEQLPGGWQFVDGVGFKHTVQEPFRPNMSAVEEALPKGYTLPAYVDLQMQLGRQHIKGAEFKGPVETKVRGADQALALSLSAPVRGKGQALQNQIYALHKEIVGVFTATALESQAGLLREAMKSILKGVSFHQT
ncbi:MAG TPA: FHA domain-containing protein [Bryobacteraceae bacterium]|jgi:hypothetical protein